MRRLIALFVFLTAGGAFAADDTKALLEAVPVNDSIQFALRMEKKAPVVDFHVDRLQTEFHTLPDNVTFGAPHEIHLAYSNFNPFRVSATSTRTAAPDPAAKAVSDFLDVLRSTAGAIIPVAGGAEDKKEQILARFSINLAEKEENCDTASAKCLGDLKKTRERCAKDLRACRCKQAATVAAEALAAINDSAAELKSVTTSFDGWVRDANGRSGILEVAKQIDGEKDSVNTVLAAARDVKGKLEKLASDGAQGTCDPLDRTTTLQLISAAADLNKVIDADARLAAALGDLSDTLKGFANRRWLAGSNDNDLIFDSVPVSADTMQTVAIKLTLKNYKINADTQTITSEDVSEADKTIIVRQSRRFVPEMGVAGVYNEIRYPKYTAVKGEGEESGSLVVDKSVDDSNVDAAVTLNFFCNCLPNTGVFPGFQLGVSKAEKYPGILLGGVLRFSQTKQLAIAFGEMLTWYKELNKLEVGQTVASQDIIDKDLRRKSAHGWYFAVQYTFGTTP